MGFGNFSKRTREREAGKRVEELPAQTSTERKAQTKQPHRSEATLPNSNVGKLKGKAKAAAQEARAEMRANTALSARFRISTWPGHCWLFVGFLLLSIVFDIINQVQDCPDGCDASIWWSELGFEWLCKIVLGAILFFEIRKFSKRGKLKWILPFQLLAAFAVVDSALELGIMAIVFELMAAMGDEND